MSAAEAFLIALRVISLIIRLTVLSRSWRSAHRFGIARTYSMALTFPLVKVTFILRSV